MIVLLTSGIYGAGFSGSGALFENISCFQAKVKKMARYAGFGDFLVSVADSGQHNPVTVIIFGDDIKVFCFA